MAMLSPYFSVLSANPDKVIDALKKNDITSLHATNGTYAYAPDMIVPTTVAGFQYLDDTHADKNAGLLVAINSDVSMRDMYNARGAAPAEFAALEDEKARVRKILPLLATQFPHRRTIVCLYDEQDPVNTYGALHAAGIDMRSLHKWGYGTGDNPKPILGAEFFESVTAFPFPKTVDHIKPVFWDVTPEGQKGAVRIVDLTRTLSSNGKPYLSDTNKLQSDVAPALRRFAL